MYSISHVFGVSKARHICSEMEVKNLQPSIQGKIEKEGKRDKK